MLHHHQPFRPQVWQQLKTTWDFWKQKSDMKMPFLWDRFSPKKCHSSIFWTQFDLRSLKAICFLKSRLSFKIHPCRLARFTGKITLNRKIIWTKPPWLWVHNVNFQGCKVLHVESSMDLKICHPNSSASHWRLSEIQQSHLSWGDLQQQPGWWQLKYVLFSPRKLGKMNPFWRAYFSKGLVQPPTTTTHCNQKLGGSTTIASCWLSRIFFCQVDTSIDFSLRKKRIDVRGKWNSKKSPFPLGKTLEKPYRLEAFFRHATLGFPIRWGFPKLFSHPLHQILLVKFRPSFFGWSGKKNARSVYGESFCW